jgi:hypothetical protein
MTDDGSGLISSWIDRTASAVATTGTTTARPTWTAGAWTANAKAGLTFDGAATNLTATTLTNIPVGSTAGEIYVLSTNTSGVSAFKCAIRYGSSSASSDRSILTNNDARQSAAITDATASVLATSSTAWTAGCIITGNWAGTTQAGRINGVDFAPSASGTIASLNTASTRLRLGASAAVSAGQLFKGVIRQVIITTTLQSADRLRLEGWLAWDGWNNAFANPLAITHTYKQQRPLA